MTRVWCALSVAACGVACACSLGPPKEPLVPTPVDGIPDAPSVPDAAAPADYPVVHLTKLDSGLTVIRALRSDSKTVGIALASRVPHPLDAGAFEARELAQTLFVQQSPLKSYGFVSASTESGVALSVEVLGADADRAMRGLVDAFRASRWPAESTTAIRAAQGFRSGQAALSARLVARKYALAHLFSGDDALAVAHHNRRSFVERLSSDELMTLVQDLYAANRTALCVVGDEEYTSAILAAAGSLPLAAKSGESLGAFVQPTPSPDTVFVADTGSYQAYVAVAGVAPIAAEADFAAMWLLDKLLGGMFTSAVNLELRERRTLTYHAYTSLIASQALGAWLFEAAVDGDQVHAALSAINQQFQRIRRDISTDEFVRARAMAVADLEARLESTGELLAWLVWRFQQGLESTQVGSFVERVRAVSREDVQRVAQTYLPERLGPIVIAGPAQSIRAQLLWSDYRVLDASDSAGRVPR